MPKLTPTRQRVAERIDQKGEMTVVDSWVVLSPAQFSALLTLWQRDPELCERTRAPIKTVLRAVNAPAIDPDSEESRYRCLHCTKREICSLYTEFIAAPS